MLMRVSIVLPANPLAIRKSFVFSQSRRVDFVQKLNPAQTFDEFVKCEAILLARLLGFVLFLFEVSIHDGAEGQAIAILHCGEFIDGNPTRLRFVLLLDLVGLLSGLCECGGM